MFKIRHKTLLMIGLFIVSIISITYGNNQDEKIIRYRGPEDWYNYEHYKEGDHSAQQRINGHADLFSKSELKNFYDQDRSKGFGSKARLRPITRLFWESKVEPHLFPTKYIKIEYKKGGVVEIRSGSASSSLEQKKKTKIYYYFAGAYWQEARIKEMLKDVYSNLTVEGKRVLYNAEDVRTREKQYSEHKPKRRIFAQITKSDSVYFLRGKMWQEVKEKKEKKPEQVARELWLKGRELMEQGNYREAIEHFEQATEKAPKYNPPYYRLSLCYEQIGETEKALENYREYLRLIEGKSGKEKIRNSVLQSIARLQSAEQD